jgi:hypothetical protein
MYNEGRILKADVKFDLLDFKPTTAFGMINHKMTLSFMRSQSFYPFLSPSMPLSQLARECPSEQAFLTLIPSHFGFGAFKKSRLPQCFKFCACVKFGRSKYHGPML